MKYGSGCHEKTAASESVVGSSSLLDGVTTLVAISDEDCRATVALIGCLCALVGKSLSKVARALEAWIMCRVGTFEISQSMSVQGLYRIYTS